MNYKLPDLKCARKRTRSEVNRRDFFVLDKYQNIGTNKKYFIITHGCQANERDSETISGILENIGFSLAKDESQADIVIINTCAIREGAEDKVFGQLGALKKYKTLNPKMIIGICGCMAQEERTIRRILDTYHQVNLVFGTHNIDELPRLISDIYTSNAKAIEVNSIEGEVIEDIPSVRNSKFKASVNIMYGCDKFCTYCIVPYTRGKERSRLMENVLSEVKQLKEQGYKEVTLLGQNVNAYGNDLNLGYDFADLLEEVAKTGINRIRFLTSHPWNFNDRMIETIKKYDNIMPYIHLPLQSGSSNVLKMMNRRYTKESYKELFDKLRNNLKGFTFTTDIIVAFPGESEKDFNDTLEMVEYCKYDNAFTFIFSPREGTPAYNMENPLTSEEKSRRLKILNEKVAYYANLNNQKYKNQITEVLVDGPSKKNPDILSGYNREGKLVNFKGNAQEGDIVNVKITEVLSFSLNGEMI